MGHVSNDHKHHSNQHKNSHKLCNETGHPIFSLMESQWKLTQTWSEFPNEGKVILEQILASKEINQSKRADCERVTVRDLSRKVNHLSKVIWDRKIITVHQVYQFHQNRLASLMIDIKVFKDKHISRKVDQENHSVHSPFSAGSWTSY